MRVAKHKNPSDLLFSLPDSLDHQLHSGSGFPPSPSTFRRAFSGITVAVAASAVLVSVNAAIPAPARTDPIVSFLAHFLPAVGVDVWPHRRRRLSGSNRCHDVWRGMQPLPALEDLRFPR